MSDAPEDRRPPGLGSRPSTPRRGTPRLRKLLRELHHQTWELELLISGLVAFGLLQLPGPVDQLQRVAWAQAPTMGGIVGVLTLTYLKLAVYTLMASFALHLVVRALWVGLVGLDSVFPRGVRYDQLNTGPITEELTRTRLPSIRQLIVATDTLASIIFAVAFAVGIIFLAAIPTVFVLLGTGLVLSLLIFGEVDETRTFWTSWGVFVLVVFVPSLTDRYLAHRLRKDGLPYRLLRGVIWVFLILSASWIFSPVFNTLSGHLGKVRVQAATLAGMVLLGVVFVGYDSLVIHGRLTFAGSPYTPTNWAATALASDSYDELRHPDMGRLDVPTIPSRIVTSSFLTLFVPWIPERMDPVVEAACPDLPREGRAAWRFNRSIRADSTLVESRERQARILACAGSTWRVVLDGEVVEVEPVFSVHPETRVRGLAWMIPTAELPVDRHLLELWGPFDPNEVTLNDEGIMESPANPDEATDDPGPAPRYFAIPFWVGRSSDG